MDKTEEEKERRKKYRRDYYRRNRSRILAYNKAWRSTERGAEYKMRLLFDISRNGGAPVCLEQIVPMKSKASLTQIINWIRGESKGVAIKDHIKERIDACMKQDNVEIDWTEKNRNGSIITAGITPLKKKGVLIGPMAHALHSPYR